MHRVLRIGLLSTTLAFLPAVAIEQGRYDRFSLAKEAVLETTAFVCAFVLTVRARRLAATRVDALLLAYVAIAVAAAAVALNPAAALRPLASLCAAFCVYAGARALAAGGARDHLLTTTVLAAGLAAAVAVLEAYRLIPALSLAGRAPGGSEGNRNLLAHLLVIGLPAIVWQVLAADDARARRVAAVALALAMAALAFSRCRAAYLTLVVVALIALGIRDRAPSLRRWRALAVAVAAGLALGWLAPTRAPAHVYRDAMAGIVDGTGTAYGRAVQYGQTLHMVAAQPWLGVGGGNWALRYPSYALADDPSVAPTSPQPANRLPSSDWLGVASENGLPAFALLALAALVSWRRWRAPRAGDDRDACWIGLMTLSAAVVVSLFDAVLTRPTPAFLTALTLGAVTPAPTESVALAPPLRRALAPAVAVAAALLLGHTLRLTAAEALMARDPVGNLSWATKLDPGNQRWRLYAAETAWVDGDCATARREAEAALAAHPNLVRADRVLRACAETHAP